MGEGLGATEVVGFCHQFGVVAGMAYLQFLRWANHEGVACLFLRCHILKFGVIHFVAVCHHINHFRIFAEHQPDKRHGFAGLLHEAFGLGEHHDVALVAHALEVLEGYAVGHSAIEQTVAAHFHNVRHHRHRCRRANPLQCLVYVGVAENVIHRFACLHIGAYHMEINR